MSGDYVLILEDSVSKRPSSPSSSAPVEDVRGLPVWKHMLHNYWLYTAADGRWAFGDGDHKERQSNYAFIMNDAAHFGFVPDQVKGPWSRQDGKHYVQDSTIKLAVVTKRSEEAPFLDTPSRAPTLQTVIDYSYQWTTTEV
mmetsp:Transcript_60703/g.154267  ORF Transcript_60703/g.154267 Transcript_60703/m.154267 type:complete len:141 (-) Transcript_60703:111-533(-)